MIQVFRLAALAAVVLWSAGPIAVLVFASFKLSRDFFVWPPALLSQTTTANYVHLWQRFPDFFGNIINSAVVTAGATLLTLAAATSAGYVYSRYRSRLLTLSAFFTIFVRMLPPIVISLPLFPVVNAIDLNDTWTVLIVLYASFFVSLGTWIMKTTIDQIPNELDEAARVDGANIRQIMTHIIVPLGAQGMIAASVFVIVYAWNEFLFAFLFTSRTARTAPLALSEMLNALNGTEWGEVFAAATLQLAPVLLIVLFARNYLIKGVTAGALKG